MKTEVEDESKAQRDSWPTIGTFGQGLKTIREAWGLSRPELGWAIGYCEAYIRKIEGDKRKPSPLAAVKIGDVFGFNLDHPSAMRNFLAAALGRPNLALQFVGEDVPPTELRQRLETLVQAWSRTEKEQEVPVEVSSQVVTQLPVIRSMKHAG